MAAIKTTRASVAAACLGWFFAAVDTVLLILFQKQVADTFHVDPQVVRITIGTGLLGSAVGGLAFAQLGDRIGRVRTLGWSVVLYSIATGGMALAPSAGWLMGFRFLAGIGTGGEWSVGFALIAEVWPRARRGAVGGVVSAMFNLGTFLAIGFFQSGLSWRWAFGLMVLPALGVGWLRRRVPESPVWLGLQAARASATVDPATENSIRRLPVIAVFRGHLLGAVMKLTAIFALVNFAFYAFSTIFINYLQQSAAQGGLGLTSRGQAPFQIVLNLGGMVGGLLAGALSDRLGRRAGFALFASVGAGGYALLYFLIHAGDAGARLYVVFAIICTSFGIGSVLGSLSSEMFPTHLRSTGPGVSQNIGKGAGGMLGPALAGWLLPKWGFAVVLALPGICLALVACLIWLLPDVSGREVRPVEGDSIPAGEGK